MPETLCHFSGEQAQFATSDFSGCARGEGPAGNIFFKSRSVAELHLERAMDHPISLTRFYARNAAEVRWRRTAEIIRESGSKFILLRFLIAGSAHTVTSQGSSVLTEGNFKLTRGDLPYLSQSLPNIRGVHESLQLWIPLHRIAHRLPAEGFVGSFSCGTPAGVAASALIQTLYRQGEHLDLGLREKLLEALIEATAECVRNERGLRPARVGIGEVRLAALLQFIQDNATSPDLSAADVACECGISRRYLSALLTRAGLHFSDLLRTARLARAESILSSSDAADRTVAEVAQLSGFHSLAYFSRVFKSARGVSPRRFRDEHQRRRWARHNHVLNGALDAG